MKVIGYEFKYFRRKIIKEEEWWFVERFVELYIYFMKLW